MIDDIRRAIIIPVTTGTISSHRLILNLLSRADVNISTWLSPIELWERPAIVKTIRAITIAGIVVMSIYLMCFMIGTLTIEDASTVVSERGDILSPK